MRREIHPLFMILKGFAILIAMVLASVALPGGCAKAPKSYRVGILVGTATMTGLSDGFMKRMVELGYVEGKTISYDILSSNADRAEELRIAEKFITDKVDLVFVFPGQPALTVKKAAKGTKIPIVFANAIIGGTDLIESVRNPGGNITGVRIPNPELTLKSLESLLELNPSTRRIMIIYDPNYATDGPILDALRSAAAASDVALQEVRVTDPSQIQTILRGLEKSGDAKMDAIVLLPDTIPRSAEAASAVLAFADKHRIPLAGGTSTMVKGGATLTAAADQGEQGELAATLADKILKGANAGSIPVETTKTNLIVNYAKARELGFDPPEGLLKQASEIIR
jgi:putative ABC transport system substrate-binding protein